MSALTEGGDESVAQVGERPSRAGAPWSLAEEDRLLDALRTGASVDTLVADFGRTRGALNSRARKMLFGAQPGKLAGDDAIAELRQLLADDPSYRPAPSIRDELRLKRTRASVYRAVSDVDLATIAATLFATSDYDSMQTAARVFQEIETRQLWSQMIERRAELLVWRSENGLTHDDALEEARAAVDRFRNRRP